MTDNKDYMNDPEITARINSVVSFLESNGISYELYRHPPLPTIEIALEYWKNITAVHCKNLFMRNHKGNRHYLISFECHKEFPIHDLEHKLRQGKLSFASEERMVRCLGLHPGSVSPFGLINDIGLAVPVNADARSEKVKVNDDVPDGKEAAPDNGKVNADAGQKNKKVNVSTQPEFEEIKDGVNVKELFPDGHRVKFFIDKDLQAAERISFHPCDNTASVVVSNAGFMKFLQLWGGEYEWIEVE